MVVRGGSRLRQDRLRRLAVGELLVWMPLGPLAAARCGLSGASHRWPSVRFLSDADAVREPRLGVAGGDVREVTGVMGGADAVGPPVTGRGAGRRLGPLPLHLFSDLLAL